MRHAGRNISADFYIVRPSDWVIAIAEVSPGKFVLVRQFRYGSKSLSWEFPAGCLQADEDPIEGARRELREETGYEGEDPTIIGQSSPNPAIQDNTGWFVLFRNAYKTSSIEWDEHEELECRVFQHEEIENMAMQGEIHHALAHAALFFLRKFWNGQNGRSSRTS